MLTMNGDAMRRSYMPVIDFNHLSTEQRLDLIDELWGSLDIDSLPLTAAQAAEIDRRLAVMDDGGANARDAAAVLSDLRARYR